MNIEEYHQELIYRLSESLVKKLIVTDYEGYTFITFEKFLTEYKAWKPFLIVLDEHNKDPIYNSHYVDHIHRDREIISIKNSIVDKH